MKTFSTLLVVSALYPASDPIPAPSARFSCVVIKRLVEKHGEHAVVYAARMRGIPEHVIEAIRKRCL